MDRQEALAESIAALEKTYGKGCVVRLGSKQAIQVDVIPTGCLPVDIATGVGGLPRGRISEFSGSESSGKTTLALCVVAQAQKRGGTAAYIDAEHALDTKYCRVLGVNVDDLLISQPDCGEDALSIAEALIKSGQVDVCVVDSVAALVPRAELAGEMGDAHVGLLPRLMSQAMRKLTGVVAKTNTCLIFINQLREKIGQSYGDPSVTTGGRALKFYASMRLDIRRIGGIKEGDEAVANRTRVKVIKNKVAIPFRECEFDLVYGEGISRAANVFDMGVEYGLINKSGAWYDYAADERDKVRWQGRAKAIDHLKANEDLIREIEDKVLMESGSDTPKVVLQ